MKKTFILFSTLVFTLVSLIMSCSKTDDGDTIPPSPLTVTSTTPTNGGGIISYELPSDSDILYVTAVYTNSNGEEISRVSSKYNTDIEVSGLNQTTSIIVQLFVVDESYNRSIPVEVEFTPLPSFIYLVQDSIEIVPDLGGVKISWDNIESKTVFVFLHIMNAGVEEVRILSSNNSEETRFVRGLESVEMTFSTRIEDFEGNTTTLEEKGNVTPLFEQEIDKSSWSLIGNLSVDGNAWEGEMTNFWDNVVDTSAASNDDSYFIIWRDQNGGSLNWPLDIVVDMNKNIKIHRFTLWQRAYWYGGPDGLPYYFQEENIKAFDLYSSNDAQEWTFLGAYDIGDPRDEEGNIPNASLEAAASGHDFELEGVSEAFRYLKISITSNFGSETYVHGSEITLFGLDNL